MCEGSHGDVSLLCVRMGDPLLVAMTTLLAVDWPGVGARSQVAEVFLFSSCPKCVFRVCVCVGGWCPSRTVGESEKERTKTTSFQGDTNIFSH